MRNIYFGGSITAGREDEKIYANLIQELEKYGTVLTDFVGKSECVKQAVELSPKYIHDNGLDLMQKSDVLVCEVTVPSLGVGYEIGRAVGKKIPVLILYRLDDNVKGLSGMVEGAHNGSLIIVKKYQKEEFRDILKEYFKNFSKL